MKSKCSAMKSNPDQVQPDAVGDLQAAGLAQVLDQAHDLSRQPAFAQCIVEGEVECHDLAALPGHGEAFLASHAQLHVVRRKFDGLARQRDRDRPARLQFLGGRGPVERRQRRLEVLRPFTQPGAQGAEVRGQVELDDLAQFVSRVDLVDVQLVRHDVAQDLGRVRRQEHQRPSEGLAHLDAGLAARGAAERREAAGQGHLRFEVLVDQRRRGHRPILQVDRLRLGGAGEVTPQRVRHERAHRRQ